MKVRFDGFGGFTHIYFGEGVFTEGKTYKVGYVDPVPHEDVGVVSFAITDDTGYDMWEDITAFTILTDMNDEPLPEREKERL